MRRFSENVEYDEVDSILLKSFMDDIEGSELSFVVFTSNSESPDYEMGSYDCVTLGRYDPSDHILSTGFVISVDHPSPNNISLNDKEFKNFVEIIDSLSKIFNRLSENYNCKCYFAMHDTSVNMIIKKKKSTKADYYHIFDNELSNYVDGWFEYQIIKKSDDYFIEFKVDSDMDKQKQGNLLAEFAGSAFETINFEEFIFIDKRTFRLKNPKIESLKLDI